MLKCEKFAHLILLKSYLVLIFFLILKPKKKPNHCCKFKKKSQKTTRTYVQTEKMTPEV